MCARPLRVAFSLLLVSWLVAATQEVGAFDVIAFEDQQAPGLAAGRTFLDFGVPVVNAQGRIAFRARLQNPLADSIWVFDPDSGLQAVAVEDDPAPGGMPGETFGPFSARVIIDDLGNIAFGSNLPGIGPAYFATNDLTVHRVAQTGMELPDAEPGNSVVQLTNNFFEPFTRSWVFNAGRLAMHVDNIADGDPDGNTIEGVWSERPLPADRQLQVIARTGVDTSFNTIAASISTNRLAETILVANFTPVKNEPARNGVWSEANGGALTLVAESGSESGGDIDFSGFGVVGINTNGQGVFQASFTDTVFTNGVFLQFFESSFPVVVNGQPAPGLADFEFLNPTTDIVSGGGQVAINARVVPEAGGSPGFNGLWAFRDSALEAVAITGDPAPGVDGGLVFNIGGSNLFEPVINREADLAFLAQLLDDTGTGVGEGIWAECDGVLGKVVALGDEIHLPNGQSIELTGEAGGLRLFGRTGNEDGRPSGFSDRGTVVFRAEESFGESAIVRVETRIKSVFASGFEPGEDNMPAFCPQ